jgi:hypothetical protein
MCKPHLCFRAALITSSLFTALAFTGCAAHVGVGYRVYDPYYGDYHVWDDHEVGYYNTWIVETHRPHREFRKLPREEKHQYWTWRHTHGDHH